MKYEERKQDIFMLDRKKYYFAHSTSSELNMGSGISVEFEKNFGYLKTLFGLKGEERRHQQTIITDRIFHLITKEYYTLKPTIRSLKLCIQSMKDLCIQLNVEYLAMPRISSGHDKINWNITRSIIKEVFEDTDINILVCTR